MEALTPMTELEAVNILLETIGESPVNKLSGQLGADVASARSVLRETSRALQLRGWHFNTETEVPFARNEAKEVLIPNNVARWDASRSRHSDDIIRRGRRAYNKTKRSYQFDGTVYADVVYYLPFEELTDATRYYVTISAARKFANRQEPDEVIYRFTARDEIAARALFMAENEDLADKTLLDNWSVGRVLRRPRRRT